MKWFTVDDMQRKYGVQRRVVSVMVKGGFVQPSRGRQREYRFSFRDVAVLRMAQELYSAGFPPARTARFLKQIANDRGELDFPQVRLAACGGEIVVRDGTALRNQRGQLVIDFPAAGGAAVQRLERKAKTADEGELTAEQWFCAGVYIEATDPVQAMSYYRRALEIDSRYGEAYVNLVCLLVDGKQWLEAHVVAEEAIVHCPHVALLHYNQGVINEELGRYPQALDAYGRALELDPTLADAHYNLHLLHEALGERSAAFRHLKEYHKLSD